MSASINNLDRSINYDEIEELISNEDENHQIDTESQITIISSRPSDERLVTQQSYLSSSITQVQNISLSLEKSLANIEENSAEENNKKSKILTVKTSSVPGPVGLLPILVR
jgi:predicted RNase H-like nuclease (RuvC/YqgF family)